MRGVALHATVLPLHAVTPVVSQPPLPLDVHDAPAVMQLPPQSTCGGTHTVVHAPLTQVWPAAQTRPHAPQFDASLTTFTQRPPQFGWPDGHTQLPEASHTPPLTSEHEPDVRGEALQAVLLPAQ